MQHLNWIKYTNGNWCDLMNVDLSDVTDFGVYLIWRTEPDLKAVYVGQGNIAQRLFEHRGNSEITQYKGLKVTWASVSFHLADGIERYLADSYTPLVGSKHPNVNPITVNLLS